MKIALSSLCFHLLDAITLLLSLVLDVFVHRLLAASLGIYKLPTVFQDRPQLTSVADSKSWLYPLWIIQWFIVLFSSIFKCSDKSCKLTGLLSLPKFILELKVLFVFLLLMHRSFSILIHRLCFRFELSA